MAGLRPRDCLYSPPSTFYRSPACAAGLPALELPAQLTTEVEKMRQQCPGHSVQHPQHRPANVTLRGQTWLGLAAKEEYCSTAEFYSGQHAHCRAGIATYYSQDVTLLSGSVGS